MARTIRPLAGEELPLLQKELGRAFGHEPTQESVRLMAGTAELERTRCLVEDGELVGTCGAYSLELTVPGATLPAAGTTWITVRPTHRRRGCLRAMLSEHFRDVRARGEPLAALWASESGIYGRFGYGPAAWTCPLEIERPHAAFRELPDEPGRLRLVEVDEARRLLPPVYAAAARERPGSFARGDAWWDRRLADPPWEREGATAHRFAVLERGGEPRGYLHHRVRGRWSDGHARSELQVLELQALDPSARAALWRFALDVDLVERVHAWNQPVDDPLPWLLADPRRLRRAPRDGLWVRLVDLPRALAGRVYPDAGRLVLRVRDAFCPDNQGTWELEAGPEGGRCRPSSAEPDLELGAEELGALYLGGHRASELARAGRVAGAPEALARADRLLAWSPQPWCPELF